MSSSFSANQFERAFDPRRLGNWEVPKKFPSDRPRARNGATRILADERGHLLPGLPRSSPWPKVPTSAWDYPKKITRALADEMAAVASNSRHFSSWLKRSAHVPLPQQEAPSIQQSKLRAASRKTRSATKPGPVRPTRLTSAVSHCPIEPQKQSPPVETPPDNEVKSPPMTPPRPVSSPPQVASPPTCSETGRLASRGSSANVSISSRPHTATPLLPPQPAPSLCSDPQPMPPLGMGYSAFQVAKTLADESRSHHPLADTIHDPLFCAAQARRGSNPGLALPSPPPGANGTPSSPMHPHRRPKTSMPLRRITEMDLAIRWDLRLPGEKIEHDKGMRVAPAVFNVVQPVPDCELPGGCNTPSSAPGPPRMAWSDEPQPSPRYSKENDNPSKPVSPPAPQQPPVTSMPPLASQSMRRSKSTPNLKSRRICAACDSNGNSGSLIKPSREEFKQAFKAGVPNNIRPRTAMPAPLNVPKPQKPFKKRSYSIATLAPPFSLWPDGSRAQDYPDHWRLASVYQHAYKPPELRRKPLLASVFQ